MKRLLVGLLAAALLSACAGGDVPDKPAPGAASPLGPARDAAPPPGEVLAFTAPGLRGAPVVGSDFAGTDVALWFWAPW